MTVTIEQIKTLRGATGAGVTAVKEALEASKGDTEKAITYLREKGLAKAIKRSGKAAQNGIIGTYIHPDRRVVTIVEVACETDFAAKGEGLQKFAQDLALHIAAVGPTYITEDNIAPKLVEEEKKKFAKEIKGKPAELADKILAGKLRKFYEDQGVLMYQPLFSDESRTVRDYLNEMVIQVGEKLEITRFVRMQIAQPTSYCNLD